MRLSSKLTLPTSSAALLFLVVGVLSPLHAAPPSSVNSGHTPPCDGNLSRTDSLRVCVSELEGVTRYRIEDVATGAFAELTASKEGMYVLQKIGPDTVRVLLANAQARSSSPTSPSSDMVSKVYGDANLLIEERRDGQHSPRWVIHLQAPQPASFLNTCEGSACTGTIIN
ncbi:hypothetical protein [Dyella flagellata]|uniref:hypothetical protein n=1 Tax=Dyella flagellata TaxID=1867833 RepID=UPI0024E17988|nr:hypothetical protein [Dyella flagellata]